MNRRAVDDPDLGIPVLKLTKNIYRSHHTMAEESPMMWDFLGRYSHEVDAVGTVTRYYSPSAFDNPDDKVRLDPDEAERLAFWQRWHSHVLGCKAVADQAALRTAIQHDRVVALAAARTLLSGLTTRRLLSDFFADRIDLHDEVVAVADERHVNHIGFQIREPLDVWLEGLALWAPRLQLDVVGVKRFPASQAFRDRVGAFAEMAQIWIRQDDMTVELELFDIHRPNPARTGQIGHLVSTDSTRALLAAAVPGVLRAVVADDEIWHYGVRMATEAEVEQLHGQLRVLVNEDERFRLRSERTVANLWHGSVHTKLTNLELDTEIEFLTYRVDWQARKLR